MNTRYSKQEKMMTQKENEKNKSIQAAIHADIQRTLDSLHLPEYK